MTVHNCTSNEGMRAGDVYVGRRGRPETAARLAAAGVEGTDGYFGNPFLIGRDGDRETVITRFETYARERLASDPEYRDRVRALHGKRLFCWCAPLPCHGNVLEAIACELAAIEAMESEG